MKIVTPPLDGANETSARADKIPRSPHLGKTCFVIMPFGIKTHPFSREEIDFDAIYTGLIERGLKEMVKPKRSDSTTASGLIHSDMIDDIISADVAIVDITTSNPNVMYELGVRHAAKRSGTVVIRRKGDRIPFDIAGIRAFEYPDLQNEVEVQDFIKILRKSVAVALDGGTVDSLVHGLFRGLNVTRRPTPIRRYEAHVYKFADGSVENRPNQEFCIITGDISDVTNVDLWVNPENTAMQMGRFYDHNTSATIRYFGSKRDRNGYVARDKIGRALANAMRRCPSAQPGTVFVTHAGELKRRNNVKRILHVAAQIGEPSKGYLTVRNVAGCISNCLKTADALNRSWSREILKKPPYNSILFPLFGIRNPDRIPELCARDLVEAAALHFTKHTDSLIDRVYFSAYTDDDLALCERAFHWVKLVKDRVEPCTA